MMLVIDFVFLLFFFKQKAAYDIRLILVGSEMCIRDGFRPVGLSLVEVAHE